MTVNLANFHKLLNQYLSKIDHFGSGGLSSVSPFQKMAMMYAYSNMKRFNIDIWVTTPLKEIFFTDLVTVINSSDAGILVQSKSPW